MIIHECNGQNLNIHILSAHRLAWFLSIGKGHLLGRWPFYYSLPFLHFTMVKREILSVRQAFIKLARGLIFFWR